ncbi:hypothetical protein RCA_04140 [Rickettsia canadensis str. CA410]|uniref:Uncharacterized protein n=1 Tax=Rickettsia canadensis str. CA410 TaxID=1105107 RepID=A0ABN4AH19_RICCA|nr:hypothetical protein RCA_04140 [Rickettsia canadensis str. CA410]
MFCKTQIEAELALLVIKHGKKYGFEVKNPDAPNQFILCLSICS